MNPTENKAAEAYAYATEAGACANVVVAHTAEVSVSAAEAGACAAEAEALTNGWYLLSRCRAAFEGHAAAAKKAAQRWYEALPAEQKVRRKRRCLVGGAAVLPDGRTVEQYFQAAEPCELPTATRRGTADQRRKWLDAVELLRRFDAFLAEHPELPRSTAATHRAFEKLYGAWARQRGLSCRRSALYTLRSRLGRGEPVDRRGRPRGTAWKMDAELWTLALATYLQPQRLPLAEVLRYVNGVALQQGKEPLGYGAVRRRLRSEAPQRDRVRYREGPRAFEAQCVPKIKRVYDMPAGEWWCLDGRKLDLMCRVPDDRRNWRRCRPVLTGVADLRSRMIVGWDLRTTENSDGILAGIKQALRDFGAPRHVILDNGLAYQAAAGTARGKSKRRAFLRDARVHSVFTRLGITSHNAIPYHAWSKPIESLWNKVKTGFDRWFWSFWGGNPRERPEQADKLTKQRVDELPTLEDLRKAFAVFLDEYHANSQSGDGTCGLSPKLVMEQYRGPIRAVDGDLLDLLCCRIVGPVKVGRDGVRWNHVRYGQTEEEVWKLYGTQVWLAIDPERADRVTLCDSQGKPLCEATNRRLSDATQEDRRAAARVQAQARKAVRQYREVRGVLLETPTTQILQAKRARALAEEEEQRKQLPEPEPAIV